MTGKHDQEISNKMDIEKSAEISECGLYRYSLSRRWDKGQRQAIFIGVNPSTADASEDDATIRKLIGFCKRNKIGGFKILNLFAFRSVDVRMLRQTKDPVGPENDSYLENHNRGIVREYCRDPLVVAMWGNKSKLPKEFRGRAATVISRLSISGHVPLNCFGTTKSGCPKHPLMLGYDTPIIPYRTQREPNQ